MTPIAAAGLDREYLWHSPLTVVLVVAVCAATALAANLAAAVFNDGVRSFMLEFRGAAQNRATVAGRALRLSWGFLIGVGVVSAVLTGTLNPFLLFLVTDVLGLWAPRRWLAAVLGAAWGAVAVGGLWLVTVGMHALPVDPLRHVAAFGTLILYLFPLFPVIAVAHQFGRAKAALAFVAVAVTLGLASRFLPGRFPGGLATVVGVLIAAGLVARAELAARRARRAAAESRPAKAKGPSAAATRMAALFAENAARLRRALPLLALIGGLIAALANRRAFAGGEPTGFLLATGDPHPAAQLEFYRALVYLPLIATASLASGTYGIAGLLLVYAVGYASPNPAVAFVLGALTIVVEVLLLPSIRTAVSGLPVTRDWADHSRNAMYTVLELALLAGSALVALQMAGGIGVAVVAGLFLLNEALGRPVIRIGAALTALLVGALVLSGLSAVGLLPMGVH
jgi:hypothetical protein